ncbi:MAG: chorismate-binding protein [Spirochaetes bacterium]|nr:chorismate-binding protein [Spirochaetota bacterium]
MANPPIRLGPGFFADGKARCLPVRPATFEAHSAEELEGLFQRVESHLARGGIAIGYVAFEAGRAWEPEPAPMPPGERLAWFALAQPEELGLDGPAPMEPEDGQFPVSVAWPSGEPLPENSWDSVRLALLDGITYQANLTGRVQVAVDLPPHRFYSRLLASQNASFAAFLETGDLTLLSLSPELFFKTSGDRIETQPMKGTAPRGRFPREDQAIAEALRRDEKTLAENRMIVDLLRNDLGRLCVAGSVEVPHLFTLLPLSTVWQMTSTIRGRLLPGTRLTELFRALFPCGSVVGAPKLSTLALLRTLEGRARGPYCGAIGWASAQEACFSVAIRTVEHDRRGYSMGVGSGLVEGSELEAERREWAHKTEFLGRDPTPFSLFTTLLWDGRHFPRRSLHKERLLASAAYFGFPASGPHLEAALDELEGTLPKNETRRVRLTLSGDGQTAARAQELAPPLGNNLVRLAPERVSSGDPFLFHKTTRRDRWERWRVLAEKEDLADYLFLNERGELTEGTIHSLRVELDGKILTPALGCGLLPGILRQEGLDSGELTEAVLTPADLRRATRLWIGNAIRPWREVGVLWN